MILQQSMSTKDAKKASRADRTALESCHIAVQIGANTVVKSVVQRLFSVGVMVEVLKVTFVC